MDPSHPTSPYGGDGYSYDYAAWNDGDVSGVSMATSSADVSGGPSTHAWPPVPAPVHPPPATTTTTTTPHEQDDSYYFASGYEDTSVSHAAYADDSLEQSHSHIQHHDEMHDETDGEEDEPQAPVYTEEQLIEMCEKPLELDQPTQLEVLANQDPLFGRVYRSDKPFEENAAELESAMTFLRAQLAQLSQTELFDSISPILPLDEQTSLSSKLPADLPEGRTARGGGGIQGPSIADGVDVDALLAEMAGGGRS